MKDSEFYRDRKAAEKKDRTDLQCMECGRKFRRFVSSEIYEVKCPNCSSYDVEVTG